MDRVNVCGKGDEHGSEGQRDKASKIGTVPPKSGQLTRMLT